MINNLSTSVLVINQDKNITFANNSLEELFRISQKLLLHKNIDNFIDLDLYLTKQKPLFIFNKDFFLKHKNKNILVDCFISSFNDSILIEFIDKKPDKTQEIKQIEKFQISQTLIRKFAHEIKNPLGGIKATAQLLNYDLDKQSIAEFTSLIIEETDRLSNLINQMLDFDKLPNYQIVNIYEILDYVLNLTKLQDEQNIIFIKDYDISIPEFYADKDSLIQAFLNLTINAMKALKLTDNEKKIIIKTRTKNNILINNQKHNSAIEIKVIDTGPGVKEDLIEKIFYPMISGFGGTGLGLNITQNIINRHLGIIKYKRENRYTIFKILLPIINKG